MKKIVKSLPFRLLTGYAKKHGIEEVKESDIL